jgi:hypothetical protein
MDTTVRLFAFVEESLPSRLLLEKILQAKAGSSEDAVARQPRSGRPHFSDSSMRLSRETTCRLAWMGCSPLDSVSTRVPW